MALLLQNQAVLVAQHTAFLDRSADQWAKTLDQWAKTLRAFAEINKTFAEIRKELDAIKAVLIRHESLLEKLPEAIREKIGFKGQ